MGSGQKVVVIGAVAAGPKAACRLKRLDADAEVVRWTGTIESPTGLRHPLLRLRRRGRP